MLTTATLFAALMAQDPSSMTVQAAAARIEGRPAAADASPLQARLDATADGGTVDVGPGTYVGDLVLDRPIRLIGRGRPRLAGSGRGSVVRVRARDVVVEGFDIDGRHGGSLVDDSSGIHIAAPHVTVRDVRIEASYFGIYLREADDAMIERVVIRGEPGRDPGEQGSGLHVYNSQRFTLLANDIADVRDGIYIQSSGNGLIRGNIARHLRYGLHYMFSDDNVFEDNRFEDGAAGAAIMYSHRLTFRRNRFLHNRGFASVGLLLKDCDDVLAEHNLIADNARGLFLEGSRHNLFRGNVLAESDVALVLFDSNRENRFVGNTFLANLSPLELVGRRTDTVFDANYWSDATEPDLDGDGFRDRPYRLTSVFDHLRGNLVAADLMAAGPAARALAVAEQAFPVLQPASVVDRRPLLRVPALHEVPVLVAESSMMAASGLVWSGGLLAAGLGAVAWGRRMTRPEAR